MSRLSVLTVLTTLVVVLAASPWCFASSITLISSGGGVYDYGLSFGPFEFVSFNSNDTITLSGLSGVTGASRASFLGTCFDVKSSTPSSVVFVSPTGCAIDNMGSTPGTVGTLSLDSSVLTTGAIDFSMQTGNEGTVTGMTQGPVGAVPVPEPAGLVLLGTGLLGLVGLARRRLSR